MELRPGLLVGKNVRLLRPLGEGGMGSVWVAEHLTLQTEVAVKLVLSQLAKDEQAVKRFTTEATAAAQIKSPHVVQVFDHGIWNGLPYIVMELLEGEDLEGRIARLGKIPLEDMAVVLKQCSKALTQAHTLGIVHRDIKPANIYLLSQGDGEIFVKLLDFGIAKRTAGENFAKTATGALIGTPFYMSPEQVMEDRMIDFHADLWALAVVAYEALTGKVPFSGASLGAICVAVNSCVYTAATQINPALPPDVDRFFAKAFSRDPNQRFGSAKEMADALIAIAQSTGWEGIAGQTGRIHLRASFPQGFPHGPYGDPRRSGTPLPGATPMVPVPPPSYSGSMHGPPPASRHSTGSGVAWPAIPPPAPSQPYLPPPSSALPARGSRTDPLPHQHHADASLQKMTLSGTTMSGTDPARRKRRVAVAIVGGALLACVVLGLVIVLALQSAKEPEPSPALQPEGLKSSSEPVPAAPPSALPTVLPADVAPPTSSSADGTQAAPSASASAPAEAASMAAPKPSAPSKSGTLLKPPAKNPPRRNHGF